MPYIFHDKFIFRNEIERGRCCLNMLIIVTLLILIVITFFSVIVGNSFMGRTIDNVVDNTLIINGTDSTLGLSSQTLFNIDPVIGFTTTIIVIVTLVALLGINILGSGLSDSAVRIMTIGITYSGIWIVFSILAEPLIKSIEMFGTLIYVVLTIGYVIGVVQKIAEG